MAKPMPEKLILPREFIRMCRRRMRAPKIADTTGVELTGGSLLMRTLIFRRLLLREVLTPDEPFVGLLIPPSVGGVLANIAVPLCGRVPVNLNYTVSSEVMNSCIRQCKIKHVLTSLRVMERLNLELDAKIVYLEDFREKVTTTDKLVAAFMAYSCPRGILERSARRRQDQGRRSADRDLHVRLDRRAEGRDAHAAQRGLERRVRRLPVAASAR